MTKEAAARDAASLQEELSRLLLEVGVDAGHRPLRLAVAELARLLGERGYALALEARKGNAPVFSFVLEPEDPTLECLVGEGGWDELM